ILDSIGEVVYDWDIVSDRLTWGPNALNVLGVGNLDQISSGRSFGELITSDSAATRYAAITGSTA
ncbi:MAG: GGDEF-domain containing protein, partial [Hyphomicrobiales bacterium]|nr:GGDEF-domain containing protein [Hyphomicrobiales bacterium]